MELEIVDKAEDGAAAFGMKIIVACSDDLGPGQTRNRRMHGAPRFFRRLGKLKRRNCMHAIGVVTRDTVRRRRARRQSRIFDSENAWPPSGAGKKRHEDQARQYKRER